MKKPLLISAGMAFILGFTFVLHAQETAAPDSIVQLAAESQGLSLVSAVDVPETGTFWLVMSNGIVPDPAPLFDPSLPVYQITDGEYLVDATAGQVMIDTGETVTDTLAGLSNDVVNVINQVQDAQASPITMSSRMAGRMMTMDDDESGGDFSPDFSFPTNSLWLQINAVSNGLAYVNLMNATDSVYEIFSKTDLTLTNWNIEEEVLPTNRTVMPFVVPEASRTNLFIWARDWTGIYTNGLPAWWIFYWFGNLSETATELDDQNNTLGYDFTNGITPNVIGFWVVMTNNYVNTAYPNMPVVVFSGFPTSYAVLVNDTNQADAVWQPYASSNLVATLGADGSYDVSIGLRGYAGSKTAAWQDVTLIKDTVPPAVTITSPTNSTVVQPMIQVQGFANEALSQITFDVSNAAGIFTNQTGYTTGQYFDTNLLAYTTNNFQCYDVPVANGLNAITVHAFDLAGNETTQTTNYTLNYSGYTNAPQLKLVWPLPNTLIGGSNFTLQATVDDDTAKIAASIVSTNGITNVIPALVERNGNVWANNLPLAAGTNTVTLTATNAAGNVSTTNFPVVQSAISLTVNPLATNYLNQAMVTVTGTVTAGENVWINGISANVAGGSWTATNVPVNPYGQANLTVQAGANISSIDGAQTLNQVQPVTMAVSSCSVDYHYQTYNPNFDLDKDYANDYDQYNLDWTYAGGGYDSDDEYVRGTDEYDGSSSYSDPIPSGQDGLADNTGFAPYIYAAFDEPINDIFDVGSEHLYTQTHMVVQPQGATIAGQTCWYLVEACALEYSNYVNNVHDALYRFSPGNVPLPPEWMKIQGQTLVNTGITNTNGAVFGAALVSAPSGVPPDVTPTFTQFHQNPLASFTSQVYQLISQCVATTPSDQSRTNLGVGEQVNLSFNPAPTTTNIIWSTTASSLAVTSGMTNLFTAPSNAANVTVTVTIGSAPVNFHYNVFEPSGVIMVTNGLRHTVNRPNIGIHTLIYLKPDSVNFGAVWVQEEQAYAVATGVYAPFNGQPHESAPTPFPFSSTVVPGLGTLIAGAPSVGDNVYSGDPGTPPPFTSGTEVVTIPWDFQVGGTNETWKTNFTTLTHNCSLDTDGTLTVSKGGASWSCNVTNESISY